MTKLTITLTVTFCVLFYCFSEAQNNSANTQTISDSIPESINEDLNFNMMFIGLSYTSNNTKNQNFKDTNIPSLIGDLTFYHHSGFWTSFTYTNYIDEKSTYDTELQLGYQRNIFEGFDLDFYYAWRNFSGNEEYQSIDFKHTVNLLSTYEYKIFALNIDNYITFGSSHNYFLDADIGLNLDFENLIIKEDLFNFSPAFSISYGTDYWIYDNMRPMHKTNVLNFLHHNSHITNTFEYQSINFYIPIIYTINNYSISISWMYSIPSKKFKLLNWDDQSAFLISFIFSPNI